MNTLKRIFVIGHPGAGKGLFAKELAKKLGWKFIDTDFDLEIRMGKLINEVLGDEGAKKYHLHHSQILQSLKNIDSIVVTTDSSILSSSECRKLLSSEFVIYLKVNIETQLARMNQKEPFLLKNNLEEFLKELHQIRDVQFENSASLCIDSSDSNLEKHVEKTLKVLSQKNKSDRREKDSMSIFHKKTHTPIHLNKKQSECLELLASGKSSKEIAMIMHISNRTVEDHIESLMGTLGCTSSKELIALFHDQP